MEKTAQYKEKRKHPRVPVILPFNFKIDENRAICTGLTLDASESGLLIQTFKNMPVGIRLSIEVSFPKASEFSNIRGVAEIIWKDTYYWEDWEGYRYGLRFTQIRDKDHLILKRLLGDPCFLNEIQLINSPGHDGSLIVRVG